MSIFLWTVQAVLAVLFAMAGAMKSTQPKDKLVEKLPWVADFSPGAVRFIGIVEFVGALGLILPAATGIATALTPLAAVGLGMTMLLAADYHARKKELPAIGLNTVLLVLAALVAWGRFGPYSF
ncbi:DoxX family protein [Streptomyces brasiliscabiei]|uniref:DoxX family protein n=1 Tax=Streptomyces brasiliscabiei TaxID=2736302 RepID=A0ABU8GQL8_9ACTN